jgi:hypothetical protein
MDGNEAHERSRVYRTSPKTPHRGPADIQTEKAISRARKNPELESHIEGPELGGVLLAEDGGQAGQAPHKPFLVPAENKPPSASHPTASKRNVISRVVEP